MPLGKVTLTLPLLEILTLTAGITLPFESVILVFAPSGFINFGSEVVTVELLAALLADGVADGFGFGVALGVGVATGAGFGDALGVGV